jgi:hypothetical protein
VSTSILICGDNFGLADISPSTCNTDKAFKGVDRLSMSMGAEAAAAGVGD